MFAKGFRRNDGRVGVRNHVAVIYTVECARVAAEKIAGYSNQARVFGFGGCYENDVATERLFQLATHPNFGGALFVSLGCECTDFNALEERVVETGLHTASVVLQRDGGTEKAVQKGLDLLATLENKASNEKVTIRQSDITLGLMTHTTGQLGLQLSEKLTEIWESRGGCVMGVQGHAEVRYNQGGMLSLAVENSADAVMQLAARGAQIVVLVTDEWAVDGSAAVPLIKVCTNADVFADMREDFDLMTLDADPEKIEALIAHVADGALTAAERLGHAQHWVGYKV